MKTPIWARLTSTCLPLPVKRTTRGLGLLTLVTLVSVSGCAANPAAPQTSPQTASAVSAPTPPEAPPPIARSDIESAQRAWCDALIAIGSATDPKAKARDVLATAYNYDDAPVLFKPTLTHGAQTFRFDKAGALAYFVGGDEKYPDDKGFALKGWKTCDFKVGATFIHRDVALAMGNVFISDGKETKVKVDKTFGYRRGADGLKIVLHHSSLPYEPKAN